MSLAMLLLGAAKAAAVDNGPEFFAMGKFVNISYFYDVDRSGGFGEDWWPCHLLYWRELTEALKKG